VGVLHADYQQQQQHLNSSHSLSSNILAAASQPQPPNPPAIKQSSKGCTLEKMKVETLIEQHAKQQQLYAPYIDLLGAVCVYGTTAICRLCEGAVVPCLTVTGQLSCARVPVWSNPAHQGGWGMRGGSACHGSEVVEHRRKDNQQWLLEYGQPTVVAGICLLCAKRQGLATVLYCASLLGPHPDLRQHMRHMY